MRLLINNLGPVRLADIELRPFNVFVGPNNTGKSFVSMLIYAALDRASLATSPRLSRASIKAAYELPEEAAQEARSMLAEYLDTKSLPPFESLSRVVQDFLDRQLEQALVSFAETFTRELERVTGATLTSMRRVQKRPTKGRAEIRSDEKSWTIRLEITGSGVKTSFESPDAATLWASIDRSELSRLRAFALPGLPPNLFVQQLGLVLVRECLNDLPFHTKYLPAARSGIMQSHRALAGSIVRRASWAGIEDMQIPSVSGVVGDFLGEIIELDASSQGDFVADAADLEQDVLGGNIKLLEDVTGYPEVLYQADGAVFPLHRTSSMVSELAPVVLYLRHILKKDGLLLIEEPEAHLHPGSQVAFAQRLVKLANNGLRLSMTTHSEFFLQQLNNAILASQLSEEDAGRLGFISHDRLAPSAVSAYLFKPTPHGTVVERLPVTQANGIPESSFGEVAEALYNQSVAIDETADEE